MNPDEPIQFQITPLGAAVVEATPKRRNVAKILRTWRRSRRLPTSRLFPTQESILDFYDLHPPIPIRRGMEGHP